MCYEFEVPSVTTAGPYRFQYPLLSITGLIDYVTDMQ